MKAQTLIDLIIATLEPSDSRVLIRLPDGTLGMVKWVTSINGEVIIETTLDARHEWK